MSQGAWIRMGVVVAGLAASGVAWAVGWDWDVEFASRHWRSASLTWAQNIHPDHPTLQWIQDNNPPPAHEMWCEYNGNPAPTQNDCSTHHTKLVNWLKNYLNTQNPPQGAIDSYPNECSSICF